MVAEILQKVGTQIRFTGSGFSPVDDGTNFTIGTPTDVTLSLSVWMIVTGKRI